MVSDRALLGTAGVFAIALMEVAALLMGHDGLLLSTSVAAVASIITYLFARAKK